MEKNLGGITKYQRTRELVASNSKYQYSFRWWVEQLIMVVIATAVCLLASINF